MPSIRDVKDLKPIIDETIKTLYGEEATNIRIRSASQLPAHSPEKELWYVSVDFEDAEKEYIVALNVKLSYGQVTDSKRL